MTPINFGLRPIGRAVRRAVSAVTFLFRDDFTTNESAPLASPRTAEPGPGIAKIKDTANTLDISGGQIVPNAAGVSANDPAYAENDGIARASGLGVFFRIRNYTAFGVNANSPACGWGSDNAPFITDLDGFVLNNGLLRGKIRNTSAFTIGTFINDVLKKLAVIARDAGYFFIDTETDTLLFVSDVDTTTPIYAGVRSGETNRVPLGLDYVRVSQLPTPWDTDYGIATERLAGARTAGDTFTHEANCLIEFEYSVVTAVVIRVAFRIQDSSNYWIIQIEGDGDLRLRELVSGVGTNRAAASGVLSGGERIVVVCDDETIKGYYDNVLAWTYSSAVNFKTRTSGEVIEYVAGGSVSDIISWPRTLSGTAKDALDAVADA